MEYTRQIKKCDYCGYEQNFDHYQHERFAIGDSISNDWSGLEFNGLQKKMDFCSFDCIKKFIEGFDDKNK